jgi:hypothetical protein
MKHTPCSLLLFAVLIIAALPCFGDANTIDGDEPTGRTIGNTDNAGAGIPADRDRNAPISTEESNAAINEHPVWKIPAGRFSVSIVGNAGLFGYFNVNQLFVPGTITLGVTPCFDARIDHYFHIGAEYMILWGKPDTTDAARFIMNANIRFLLSVPVHPKINIEALIIGGASIWPKADTTSVLEPTFFEDRFGWNVQPALGVDYKITRHWSVVLTAGYLVNTTVVKEITITHDMMLVTLGPRLRF